MIDGDESSSYEDGFDFARSENPLIGLPNDLHSASASASEEEGGQQSQQPTDSLPRSDLSSLLRKPVPLIKTSEIPAERRGMIRRPRPLAKQPKQSALNLRIGNLSLSMPISKSSILMSPICVVPPIVHRVSSTVPPTTSAGCYFPSPSNPIVMEPAGGISAPKPLPSMDSTMNSTIRQQHCTGDVTDFPQNSPNTCSNTCSSVYPNTCSNACPTIQVIQPVIIYNTNSCPSSSTKSSVLSACVNGEQGGILLTEMFGRNAAVRCTCSKSHCLQRYCKCLRAGRRCSAECKCVNCHNRESITSSRSSSTTQRFQSTNGSQSTIFPFQHNRQGYSMQELSMEKQSKQSKQPKQPLNGQLSSSSSLLLPQNTQSTPTFFTPQHSMDDQWERNENLVDYPGLGLPSSSMKNTADHHSMLSPIVPSSIPPLWEVGEFFESSNSSQPPPVFEFVEDGTMTESRLFSSTTSLSLACKQSGQKQFPKKRAKIVQCLHVRGTKSGKRKQLLSSCACQKSLCNKRSCSCYKSGQPCSDNCQCVDCHNQKHGIFYV